MLKRCKAFISIDFMLTILPLLLMVVFYIEYSTFYTQRIAEIAHRQNVFDALVSIADYVVKMNVVVKKDNAGIARVAYPNWIEKLEIDEEALKEKAGLKKLHVGFDKSEGICIYRLVVYGKNKEIRKLYVCGE